MILEQIICQEIEKLPRWCRETANSHEWIVAYGEDGSPKTWKQRLIEGDKQLPNFICKHCHAIGKYHPEHHVILKVR